MKTYPKVGRLELWREIKAFARNRMHRAAIEERRKSIIYLPPIGTAYIRDAYLLEVERAIPEVLDADPNITLPTLVRRVTRSETWQVHEEMGLTLEEVRARIARAAMEYYDELWEQSKAKLKVT